MDNLIARGLLVAAVIALVCIACWRAPLWRWVAAASTGSLLVAPHIYGYDAGLLLASLWLAIFVCIQKWVLNMFRGFVWLFNGVETSPF